MLAGLRKRALSSIWLGVTLLAGEVVVGCGDDDATATDAGPMDASSPDGGAIKIPRRDASVSTADPIPICDRSDPLGCGPGQVCGVVIRRAPSEQQFSIYTGCIEAGRQRAAGDPCDPEFTNGEPYSAPDLLDEVYTDPCAAGLICAPDRVVRGGASCQPACSSGLLGDSPFGCQSSTALCLSAGQFVEFCRESERCDVAKQTGCKAGEGCYMRPSLDGKSLLAVCRTLPQKATANGEVCPGFYACNPGSLCLGPVHLPPSRWQQTDLRCRPACSADGADQDAGADDDAGVRGSCRAPAQCAPFSESGLNLSGIPKPPFGQCEP